MFSRRRLLIAIALQSCASCVPTAWPAEALLRPKRRPLTELPRRQFENIEFKSRDVTLRGWRFRTDVPKRGIVVYLHGVGDNRQSGLGIAEHFLAKGFDVLVYDSRAHGESSGEFCTYGFYEKHDLSRIIDRIDARPVLLFGVSLGAAVALQTASGDTRVAVVIAVATFSDLRTVAVERAPFFISRNKIEQSLRLAESQGAFSIDEVSPVSAARRIQAPTLLVHGAMDRETPPEHSQRVYEALRSPKRFLLVPDKGHNDSLTEHAWIEIDSWIESHYYRA